MALAKQNSDHVQWTDDEKPITTIKEGYIELGHRPRNPIKSIRDFCVDCSGGSYREALLCRRTSCQLFQHREGVNTFRKPRTATAERRAILTARLPGRVKDNRQRPAENPPTNNVA